MFLPYVTRNFDDTPARIKKLVSILDKYWFQEKKKEFEELCEPGMVFYIIDHEHDDNEEYLKSQVIEEHSSYNDSREAVYFDKFCFFPDYSSGKVCGKNVAEKILSTTYDLIKETGLDTDYRGYVALIEDVKHWIDEEASENITHFTNEEYTKVLRGTVEKIKWTLDRGINDKIEALKYRYERSQVKELKQVPKSRKAKVLQSYKWQGEEVELKLLYQQLKGKLISEETRLTDFKQVFLRKDISSINPIKWHDNNASELLYFITQLSEKGLIAGKRQNYQVLTACFIMTNGNKFTASFKNLKQSLETKLSGQKMEMIDVIVRAFT